MEKFKYRVKDKEGNERKGIVEALNQHQAVKILHERGFLIISLHTKTPGIVDGVKGGVFTRVSESDRVNFTRQFATMITAGLPITDALNILELQASPTMAKIIGDILREVEGGGNLATAMEKHSEVFDKIYVSLIRSGEAAGVLDKVLTRLADNLEKQREFTSKVKSAMIYPIIVVGGMIVVFIIMIIFVIPKMTSIYEEFKADLPIPTKILIGVSHFATNYWWLAIILVAGCVVGIKLMSAQPNVRRMIDDFMFKIPIIGKLRKQIMLTEFTRTMSLLVGAGILIVEAIEIGRGSLTSITYNEAIQKAGKEVEKGLPFATALARSGLFPPILPQMVAVGEETGKIDDVLGKVSNYFEQEADEAVKGLTSALEPLIMIVLGLGVGFLMMAVIMPIYQLTSQF